MTGWTFRASWPIRDPGRLLSMLKTEACEQIDNLAAENNARIVGAINWTVVAGRLIAEAPARPITTERIATP